MKLTIIMAMACLVLMSHCTSKKTERDFPIMGSLSLGEFAVGFTTLFVYDETRSAVPFADWNGKLYRDHDPEHGRQYQINIWYPALDDTGEPLKYEDYVNLMGQQTNFSDTPDQQDFAQQTFVNQTNDLGDEGHFTQADLEQLMHLDVLGQSNAAEISGKFPIVVFPNGSSPAFQSITAEFLTSHGYVVVAFAPKGRFSSGLEVSGIGLEVAVDDLEFVMTKVAQLPYADLNQVALLANAISSSVCAAAVARNDKYKALISLEGGLPSAFEQRLLNESVFYKPENIRAPMLFVYAPHPSIDPKHTYHLKHSAQYYAHFPTMSEFVMLNYGMFDSFIPDIIGKQKAPPQKGFETANALMLRFLNIQLKEAQIELFDDHFLSLSENIIDTTFVLPALAAAPNIALMKDLFVKRGFDAMDSTYEALKEVGNTTPFSESFISAYRSWLAWQKDPDYQYRARLYTMAFDSYPGSSEVNYYLGYYQQKTGDISGAISAYERAIASADASDITKSKRDAILRNASEGLEGIKE
ncbi:MAG: hypothetical protein RIF33_06560 [Cyclobacteriaceae bacterium]